MAGTLISRFRSAPSFGWAWLLGITLLIALSAVPLLQPGLVPEEEQVALWITAAILVPLVVYMLVILASIPAMRYDVTSEGLVLSCGPLMRYRVAYTAVSDVRRTTLTPTLWSSMRMPGLALGTVLYADVGKVRMCAKRMARDILLITADGKRYGITPADEAAFIAALSPMLPQRAADGR
jgi:hypothetical protein